MFEAIISIFGLFFFFLVSNNVIFLKKKNCIIMNKNTICFFFFFDMSTQEGGRGIRTSDLRFIRRGLSRLNYLLKTIPFVFFTKSFHFHPHRIDQVKVFIRDFFFFLGGGGGG
jgi:hypothetical protein